MTTRRERSIICLMEFRISWGIIVTKALLSFASAISMKRLAAAPVSTGIDFIAIAMTVCCLLNTSAKVRKINELANGLAFFVSQTRSEINIEGYCL